MGWKTFEVNCEEHGVHDRLENIPYGEPLPEAIKCAFCDKEARRIIGGNISKKQIEERVHGGQMVNGQLIRRATGWKAAEKQHELDTQFRRAMKKGDADTAAEIGKDLIAARELAKKNIGKAQQ